MALYAYDVTSNIDEDEDDKDTNVVQFSELYQAPKEDIVYIEGVGARFGAIGKLLGELMGVGGRSRVAKMYDELEQRYKSCDTAIDSIGYSRGDALAGHITNTFK